MGAPLPFSVVGAISVDVVNWESKLHAFVGWLSGRKDCFNVVELCAVVGEWGPIVAQDDGRRYRNIPILFHPVVYVKTILGPQSLSFGLARFVPMRNL